MIGFCPSCEKDSPLTLLRRTEEFNIRGELIPVEVEYYQCQECGEEYENPRADYDPYEVAYQEYKTRKEMVQPEEIRDFRIKHGLTQKEFSGLLGIGIATLNRYENGALQSEAHDRLLKQAMESVNFFNLVSRSRNVLNDKKKQTIMLSLQREIESYWMECTKNIFGSYSGDEFSGYKNLELEKLIQAVKYFCYKEPNFKTKLVKLLFYADFGHFKNYTVSITGSRYTRQPFGPVPDQFDKWFVGFGGEEEGFRKEEVWCDDHPGEIFICEQQPDLSIFSPSEMRILATVKERLQGLTPKEICEFTTHEKAYQETLEANLIPYSYAEELSFDF